MSRTYPHPARGRRGGCRRRRLLEAGPRAQARARPPSSSSRSPSQQAQLAQTQSLITTYEGARDAYKTNYATVVRLGKAVPTDDDTRSLLVQLDAAAKRSGVDFDTINVNGGGGAASGTAPARRRPGRDQRRRVLRDAVLFSFNGDFATLGDFFSRLERFVSLKGDEIAVSGRLLRDREHLARSRARRAGRR